MSKPTQPLTRRQQLAADIKRWRSMKVVFVNEPDPIRAEHVMQIVVNSNLRRLETQLQEPRDHQPAAPNA